MSRWMMTRVVLMVAMSIVAPRWAEAASGDADGTYTVSVTKVELSKDSGATYITVFSGSQEINIASANAGAVAAGLASGVSCEAGTYDRIRVTLGSTLLVKGFVTDGPTTYYTNGITFGVDVSAYATSTFTISNPVQVYTVAPPIAVQPGSSPKVTVSFNTSGVIVAGPSINPPSVTIASS